MLSPKSLSTDIKSDDVLSPLLPSLFWISSTAIKSEVDFLGSTSPPSVGTTITVLPAAFLPSLSGTADSSEDNDEREDDFLNLGTDPHRTSNSASTWTFGSTGVKGDGLLRSWGPFLGEVLSKVDFKVVEEVASSWSLGSTCVKGDGLLRPWGPLLGVEVSKIEFKVVRVRKGTLEELKWDSEGDANPPVGKFVRIQRQIVWRKEN
jgi:hypothetical protein